MSGWRGLRAASWARFGDIIVRAGMGSGGSWVSERPRDLKGFEGIRRDLKGFEGISRDEGFWPKLQPPHPVVLLACFYESESAEAKKVCARSSLCMT